MKKLIFFICFLLSGLVQAQTYSLSNFLVTLPETKFGSIVPNPSNLILLHGASGYSLWRLRPNDKQTPAGPNILIHPGTLLRYERLLTSASSSGSGPGSLTTIQASNVIGLGTAALYNVPTSGDANSSQVLLGSDTRLTNSRTPTAHTHILTDVTGVQAALDLKVPTSRTITSTGTISGGNNLGSNLVLDVVPNTTIQRLEFLNAGSLIGTRKRLNVTTSGDAAITLTDDPGNDRVNLNISATAGSGTMPAPSGTGLVVQDGVSSTVTRSITSSSGIAITNGSGVVGNINIAPSSELAGVQALSSTGPVTRTGSGTYTAAALDLGSGSLTGTLAAARMPAITGDISVSVGTTVSTYNGVVPSNKGGAGTINGLIKANGSGTTSLAVSGTDYLTPSGSAANLTSFPTLNQNTTGTAANLSGTPNLPNGTTATTQTLGDNSTKIATTAFVYTAANTRPLIVDNVATLKTIAGAAGYMIQTKGYYSDGDGGGNTYYWNTTSTVTENGGTIIKATATSTGRWMSRNDATEVTVKQFGAKGDNTTDDTTPIATALAFAVENSKVLVFQEGKYLVSAVLLNKTDYAGNNNLLIRIDGNVELNVNPSSSAIHTSLITFGHNTGTSVSITGHILNINLNNKCRGFLEANNFGIVSTVYYTKISGEATIKASSLTVENSYASTGGDGISYGIYIAGTFKRVTIENVTVNTVARYAAGYGECKGIAVSNLKGECYINNCTVSNVLCNATYMANADGIAVFGIKENSAIENSFRTGTATITNCVLTDNQGRNIKIQTSVSTIQNCKFYRQYVITIDNGHDIDIQFGNGKILNNICVYKKNGATSPLGTYFAAFKFQQVLPNKEMYSLAENNTVYTEAVIPYVFFITHGNSLSPDSVKASITEAVNNHVINTGTFVGTGAVQRGFVEFNADEVAKVVGGKHQVNVRNNSFFASSTSALLSYNNAIYNIKSDLTFRLVDNQNTNTGLTPFMFHNYYSGQVDSVDTYQVWGNQGFSESFHTTWKINLSKGKIIAPSRIAFDLYYHTLITNKPPTVGTSGNAIISVLGDWASGNAKVEIYENTGGTNDYLHYTTSASTWKKATFN